jgi:hypothetical protein
MWKYQHTSTLVPSRGARDGGGAGDPSSPFVTVERFDFLPGMAGLLGKERRKGLLFQCSPR